MKLLDLLQILRTEHSVSICSKKYKNRSSTPPHYEENRLVYISSSIFDSETAINNIRDNCRDGLLSMNVIRVLFTSYGVIIFVDDNNFCGVYDDEVIYEYDG